MTRPLLPTAMAIALLLAGCAARPPAEPRGDVHVPAPGSAQPPVVVQPPLPPPTQPSPREAERPVPAAPAVRAAVPPLPAAARRLAAQAETASDAGDHDAAAAHLERALRIAPGHPVLWQNLAVVRYRQGDYAKVEGPALKSNSLAAGAADLRARNWSLIAEARRQQGDPAGADAAAAEARRLAGRSAR